MRMSLSSPTRLIRLASILVVLGTGCSHQLTIKNIDSYRTYGMIHLNKPLTIGIMSDANVPEQQKLLDGVSSALAQSSARVIFPFSMHNHSKVDVIANVEISSEHKGSGWNFLINWPGFFIFTPAWHGYNYEVRHTIHCTLTEGETKAVIDTFQIPIALDIRHAAINRTWTEISWLEVSAIAFVGGLVFINYDESVTPLVSEKVEGPLGKYIAHEIVKRINASGKFVQIHENSPKQSFVASQPNVVSADG